MNRVRLFFALDTPEPALSEIVALSRELRKVSPDVRWEPPSKLHCTLKFLGDTDEALIEDLCRGAANLASSLHQPRVVYRGLGAFPSQRNPNVVWIGMDDPSGTLLRLNRGLEEACLPLGISAEERPFHAHVTLCRVKGRHHLTDLIRSLESLTFETAPVVLRDLHLIRSDLRQTGSVYTTLRTFPIGT
jgi:2'-5' RNA ligase